VFAGVVWCREAVIILLGTRSIEFVCREAFGLLVFRSFGLLVFLEGLVLSDFWVRQS